MAIEKKAVKPLPSFNIYLERGWEGVGLLWDKYHETQIVRKAH